MTHETRRTGAVFRVCETAVAAPVSSTLLVKTSMAPERKLYLAERDDYLPEDMEGLAPECPRGLLHLLRYPLYRGCHGLNEVGVGDGHVGEDEYPELG